MKNNLLYYLKPNLKNTLTFLFIFLLCLFTNSCEELSLERLSIEGTVVDASNITQTISGASLTIQNTDIESKLSDSDGNFAFNDLEFNDGTYEIVTTADNYKPKQTFVSVKNGAVNGGDITIQLTPLSSISVNTNSIGFGAANTTNTVTVTNDSNIEIEGDIEIGASWLTASPTKLNLQAKEAANITFIADREKVDFGTFSTNIIFSVSNTDAESVIVQASLQKIDPSNPSVSVDQTTVDFGKTTTKASIEISNEGTVALNWSGGVTESWITLSQDGGSLAPNSKESLDITINRNNLAVGTYTGTINFIANGKTTSVTVTMEVETLQQSDQDNDGVIDTEDVDDDNDGLIEIYTIDDLNNIRNDLNASGIEYKGGPLTGIIGYELMNDLDFNNENHYVVKSLKTEFTTGFGWLPFYGESNEGFNTVFEGNNHTIKNLFINRDATDSNGLFGWTRSLSNIKNLHIEISYLHGNRYSGGLVGYNEGSITGCSVKGQIISTGSYIGLLIGFNKSGNITSCYTEGLISSSSNIAGGLIGGLEKGDVTFCYSKANVNATSNCGGLIGYVKVAQNDMTINSCYATGNVKSGGVSGDIAGGLLGSSSSSYGGTSRIITNCYATGSVSCTDEYAGGLVGFPSEKFLSCFSTGKVSGARNIGGLLGYGYYSVIVSTKCYWDITTSEITTSVRGGVGKTTIELQTPTATTGIYATWDANAWDFGTSSQYPALKGMPNGLDAQRN